MQTIKGIFKLYNNNKKYMFGENTPLLLGICTVSSPEGMIKTSIMNRILPFLSNELKFT